MAAMSSRASALLPLTLALTLNISSVLGELRSNGILNDVEIVEGRHDGMGRLDEELLRPELPDEFTAYVSRSSSIFPEYSNSTVYYDRTRSMESQVGEPVTIKGIAINGTLTQSIYYEAKSAYFVGNGVCRSVPVGFHDKWHWVRNATYGGHTQYRGRKVQKWYARSPLANYTLFVDKNLPVLFLSQTYEALPGMKKVKSNSTEIYLNISVGAPPLDKLSKPRKCTAMPPPCKVAGNPVKTLSHYIAHPPDIFNLSDQDTADELGDTAFTCYDVSRGHTKADDYGVISHYRISVDTRYGQYALCNGYPGVCVGGDEFRVGREASIGIKPNGGHCSDNLDTGSWFSFPSKGRCTSREALIEGTCTWFVEERVKTINISCPFRTHKMIEACSLYETPAYATARSIFRKAFLFEDESAGGCKDLGGPPRRYLDLA